MSVPDYMHPWPDDDPDPFTPPEVYCERCNRILNTDDWCGETCVACGEDENLVARPPAAGYCRIRVARCDRTEGSTTRSPRTAQASNGGFHYDGPGFRVGYGRA